MPEQGQGNPLGIEWWMNPEIKKISDISDIPCQ